MWLNTSAIMSFTELLTKNVVPKASFQCQEGGSDEFQIKTAIFCAANSFPNDIPWASQLNTNLLSWHLNIVCTVMSANKAV